MLKAFWQFICDCCGSLTAEQLAELEGRDAACRAWAARRNAARDEQASREAAAENEDWLPRAEREALLELIGDVRRDIAYATANHKPRRNMHVQLAILYQRAADMLAASEGTRA